MLEVAFKIAILALLGTFLVTWLENTPDATSLPGAIETGLNWLLSKMYFFNDILNVPVFMTVIYYMINGFIVYLGLLLLKLLTKWVIGVA